jgi:hypothetical protein
MMKDIEMSFTKDSQIEYMPTSHSIGGMNIDLQEGSTFPNLGFIFTGFSLPSSNPFSEIGLDPGMRVSPIFSYNYSDPVSKTSDNRYILPHGLHGVVTQAYHGLIFKDNFFCQYIIINYQLTRRC